MIPTFHSLAPLNFFRKVKLFLKISRVKRKGILNGGRKEYILTLPNLSMLTVFLPNATHEMSH